MRITMDTEAADTEVGGMLRLVGTLLPRDTLLPADTLRLWVGRAAGHTR